ncbi:MAG: LysM peptidoglycan-binding domain-containing protein [Anaerolineaceae bacterium]|nr:LysM peptidoglycan-binding domain-containing protein [Anaerolineaceae bacterium]
MADIRVAHYHARFYGRLILVGVRPPKSSRYPPYDLTLAMRPKTFLCQCLVILLLVATLIPLARVQASPPQEAQPAPFLDASAYDLIAAMNMLRVSNGLPALIEDPIIDAVAQSTAEIMAANQMSWHIGNASGRIASAGYGGGAKVWATENFAVGSNYSIDQIMVVWSDASHMLPAVTPAYCHVGAGVAKSGNGMTYYVLQAAYTSGNSCGPYSPSPPGANGTPAGPVGTARPVVSQIIIPVKVATPDADGKVFHVVAAGQSFWAIAVTYKVTIRDLEVWNNLSRDSKLQVGQKLFIPSSNTIGYATPTPVGMIQVSSPDADGKIVHTVQAYQALITIAQAYGTTVEKLLALNGLQADWPLQIGQKLVIHPGFVTPSPTPRPLTPVEKLTPASDGKYYHTVKSGETLSWIAQLYKIGLSELMSWNGLSTSSILYPDQKLVLQLTPPATPTATPGPPTVTPTPTSTEQPFTPTATIVASTSIPPNQPASGDGSNPNMWLMLAGLSTGGVVLLGYIFHRNQAKKPPQK